VGDLDASAAAATIASGSTAALTTRRRWWGLGYQRLRCAVRHHRSDR